MNPRNLVRDMIAASLGGILAVRHAGALSLVLALTTLASCKRSAPENKPEIVSLAELTARNLPPLRSGSPVTGSSVNVLITKDELRLNDVALFPLPDRSSWADGFDAKYKGSGPRDHYLVPLADALERARDGGTNKDARVVVDGDVSYRILTEVLYTLGQSEVEAAHLLVPLSRTEAGIHALAQIDVLSLRAFSGSPTSTSPNFSEIDRALMFAVEARLLQQMTLQQLEALNQSEAGSLHAGGPPAVKGTPSVGTVDVTTPPVTAQQRWFPSLSILRDGVHGRLYAYDGNHTDIGPNCTLSRQGATVERAPDGSIDLGALESCLRGLKAERAAPGASDVVVSALPATPYRDLLRVIDAARGARGDLLATVHLRIRVPE